MKPFIIGSVPVIYTWALSWSRRRFWDCSMDLSISDFLSCSVSNRRSKCSLAWRSASWPFSFKKQMSGINFTLHIKKSFCFIHIISTTHMYWKFFSRKPRVLINELCNSSPEAKAKCQPLAFQWQRQNRNKLRWQKLQCAANPVSLFEVCIVFV